MQPHNHKVAHVQPCGSEVAHVQSQNTKKKILRLHMCNSGFLSFSAFFRVRLDGNVYQRVRGSGDGGRCVGVIVVAPLPILLQYQLPQRNHHSGHR